MKRTRGGAQRPQFVADRSVFGAVPVRGDDLNKGGGEMRWKRTWGKGSVGMEETGRLRDAA